MSRRSALAAVWLFSAVLLASVTPRGLIPHDEGLLAQGAERVLRGELPHVDFDASYTGGLEYLHALGFRVFGERLLSLHIVLLIGALLFVPAFFSIAARVLTPSVAGLVTIAALLWSLPVYFSSLPSWYILFLSVFAMSALLRFMDSGRRRWIFFAGACAGLAFLAKAPGIFILPAGGLFLLRYEQEDSAKSAKEKSIAIATLIVLGCAALDAALVWLIHRHLALMEAIHFVLPGVALTTIIADRELKGMPGSFRFRGSKLLSFFTPFVLGAAIPVALFLVRYVEAGGVGDFIRGVFILPQKRLSGVAYPLPPAWTLVAALPLAGLLIFSRRLGLMNLKAGAVLLGLVLAPFVFFAGIDEVYRSVWYSVRPIIPICAVGVFLLHNHLESGPRKRPLWLALTRLAALPLTSATRSTGEGSFEATPVGSAKMSSLPSRVARKGESGDARSASQRGLLDEPAEEIEVLGTASRNQLALFLTASMAAFVSLMQFPYSSGVYFCYVAPLAALALAFLVASFPAVPRALYAVVLAFYLLFAAVWIDRGLVRRVGERFVPNPELQTLDLPRGGTEVTEGQAARYELLVAEIQKHSVPYSFIYATPDCPEVYFLSDRQNPTRTMYEAFDADFEGNPAARRARILKLLEDRNVNVVVLSSEPEFSGPTEEGLAAALAQRYPHEEQISIFTLRWRS